MNRYRIALARGEVTSCRWCDTPFSPTDLPCCDCECACGEQPMACEHSVEWHESVMAEREAEREVERAEYLEDR